MNPDPMTYILAASAISATIGFFGCALICSHKIRRAELNGWKAGVRFYQDKAHQSRETPRL